MTLVILLAELLAHIPTTPGILTQVREAASPMKNFPFEMRVFTSVCTDVNCSPVCVVKWGNAGCETVFPVCQHLCEKKRGKKTSTRVCGHTCEGLPSTDGTDCLREAGRPSGRKSFHCVPFGSFWVWSLVNSLPIQITTFGFSKKRGEASTQAYSLIHKLHELAILRLPHERHRSEKQLF